MSLFYTVIARKRETPAIGGGSSLLTGLNAYYALEDLTEEVGGLTLTNVNAATFATGKVNNSANFVAASSQRLSRADNAAFQMGGSINFTIACWGKFTSIAPYVPMISYGKVPGTALGYYLGGSSAGIVAGLGYNSSSTQETTALHTFNDGNFHFAVATFDRTGNMTCYVDNVLEHAVSISAHNGETINSAVGLSIGGFGTGTADSWTGSVDEVGIWNRILTGAEMTTLYNSGTGITYPF